MSTIRKTSIKEVVALEKATARITTFHKHLKDTNQWLHEGQVRLARNVFQDGYKDIMAQLGRNWGKLLNLSEVVPTPDRGFVQVGELRVGDFVFGASGCPCKIIALSDIDPSPEMYRLTFSDGTTIDACKDHQWLTSTKSVRRSQLRNTKPRSPYPVLQSQVITTLQIKNTLKYRKEYNHSLPCASPLQLPAKQLLLDPYLLGVWLGDGGSKGAAITGVDEEIFSEIEKLGFRITRYAAKKTRGVLGLQKLLISLRVWGNKHVPDEYLWSSIEQRIALLQGLMDTDGTIETMGRCCFDNTNKQLADSVYHLLVSLGEKPHRETKIGKLNGIAKRLVHRVKFQPNHVVPFRLSRKKARLKPRGKPNHRFIINVESIPTRPGRCLEVDAFDHLFLVGRQMVPTHNSHCARYCAARYAIENKYSAVYLGAPERTHAYEIHWTNPNSNIITMIPSEFLTQEGEAIFKSELRVVLSNGSFIKLIGADNIQALRGIKPHLLICDEFQDWTEEAWTGMAPNLASYDATVIKIGTPPDRDGFYIQNRSFILDRIKEGSKRHFYIELPTETNPRLSRDFLKEEKHRLCSTGREAEWEREYMAKYIPGGATAIYPTWKREFIRPHDELLAMVEKDKHKLKWLTVIDPGSTSTFAVLFVCYNQFASKLFLLGEIYERDPKLTRTILIWDRIIRMEKALCPTANWRRVYDQAAPWFANEIHFHYRTTLEPTNKWLDTKANTISLTKDIMGSDALRVSDKLPNFVTEIEGYCLDRKGNLPDLNDHLMDCLNYAVAASNFRFYNQPAEGIEETPYGSVKWNSKRSYDWTDNIGFFND